MTRSRMTETPIEDLDLGWIGMTIEVDTPDGSQVGFRLARYEKTTRDGEPLWILFSTDHPWRTELTAGAKIRWIHRPADPGRPTGYYVPQQQYTSPVAAPPAAPAPGPLNPSSWVTPPAPGTR
ncbi:hypothetical protein AB0B42_29120 [Streptomyces fradiae]|uniref:hypothetical protein n=1 Tax=Streptomyces fradiae TaxID=1906 RepID=UPI0033EB7D2E